MLVDHIFTDKRCSHEVHITCVLEHVVSKLILMYTLFLCHLVGLVAGLASCAYYLEEELVLVR